jgi:tetratricopeptide (TPR) repeat protein
LERIASLAPNDFTAQLTLVNFLSEAGQVEAAVNTMRQLMTLISLQQTQDYQRFQDFNTQLQDLAKLIDTARKSPNDIEVHRTLAQRWKARGQPQFALPEYSLIARLLPTDYDAQKNIAFLSLQSDSPSDAQGALIAAAALAPTNEKALWQNLQAALDGHKAGKFDEALKAAQAALALTPDVDKPSVQAYVTLLQDKLTKSRN